MDTYVVKIRAFAPAPREFEYRMTASSAATAIARSLRSLRKDLPRKRIEKYEIFASKL